MATRAQLVAEARTWVETPVRHQGDNKALGCDCVGLIRGVLINVGLVPRDWRSDPGLMRRYAPYANYGREPDGHTIAAACGEFLSPLPGGPSAIAPGDVVLMRFAGDPRHLGIVADHPSGSGLTVIHAYQDRVAEHGLDVKWRRRVIAAFQIPGLS